ncbi:MAG: hypothetical protein K9G36_00475 [Crocinitomicaceae bacterium]|nr:hypothetical protein [Crocinitomicaceae bacterium]MCF8410851.1 hypothetical protein [Crocinitomicaceae bacterium]
MKTLIILTMLFPALYNAQALEEIVYTTRKCHARGITADKSYIYVSTNDGSVFKINPKTKKSVELIYLNNSGGELRDIELVNHQILAMQSGDSGLVINVNTNQRSSFHSVFLDGMDFYGNSGFLMGDPINDTFSLFFTINNGKTWNPCEGKILAKKGEAGFAASGSTVHCLNDSTFMFVSGGLKSRFFISTNFGSTWNNYTISFPESESAGPFSIVPFGKEHFIAVGGDYKLPNDSVSTCFVSTDAGKSWVDPIKRPLGYRSCIIAYKNMLFTCGTNGLDYSLDGGMRWTNINNQNYLSLTVFKDKLVASTSTHSIHLFDLKKFKH